VIPVRLERLIYVRSLTTDASHDSFDGDAAPSVATPIRSPLNYVATQSKVQPDNCRNTFAENNLASWHFVAKNRIATKR
jgi:hypothetical protein